MAWPPYGRLRSPQRPARSAAFAPPPPPASAPAAEPRKVLTHGVIERHLAELFRRVGLWVGRRPRAAIGSSLLLALCCALLVPAFLTFEADPVALYIPQRSALAQQRRYIERTFGLWDEPGILVVKHKTPGASITNAGFLLAALDLHERVQRVRAPLPSGEPVSMRDVCAQRFVTITGEYHCMVLSVFELWGYSRDKLASDTDLQGTLATAHANSELDLGGLVAQPPGHAGRPGPGGATLTAQALQLKYFFNISVPHYRAGGTLAWDRALRALLDEVNGAHPLLQVSYWSALFIDEEAQSFVHKVRLVARHAHVHPSPCAARGCASSSVARRRQSCVRRASGGLARAAQPCQFWSHPPCPPRRL